MWIDSHSAVAHGKEDSLEAHQRELKQKCSINASHHNRRRRVRRGASTRNKRSGLGIAAAAVPIPVPSSTRNARIIRTRETVHQTSSLYSAWSVSFAHLHHGEVVEGTLTGTWTPAGTSRRRCGRWKSLHLLFPLAGDDAQETASGQRAELCIAASPVALARLRACLFTRNRGSC